MGYTTDFSGSVEVKFKDIESAISAYEMIEGLAETRRMKRDLTKIEESLEHPVEYYGVDGELYYPKKDDDNWECCGQGKDDSIVDYNKPPSTQPGLWLQWVPSNMSEDRLSFELEWDQGEKFYHYTEWMKYIINNIVSPRGGIANGTILWRGEDFDDVGSIIVTNNNVAEGSFDR